MSVLVSWTFRNECVVLVVVVVAGWLSGDEGGRGIILTLFWCMISSFLARQQHQISAHSPFLGPLWLANWVSGMPGASSLVWKGTRWA